MRKPKTPENENFGERSSVALTSESSSQRQLEFPFSDPPRGQKSRGLSCRSKRTVSQSPISTSGGQAELFEEHANVR